MNKKILAVYATMAIIGGAAIFTIPLRTEHPMPESGLTTEPCTLDEEVARIEEEIDERKAVLDAVLESAQMVKEAKVVSAETDTTTEEATETEAETTKTEAETETEPETEPETTVEIYQPCASMMAADLQAWVYAYSCQEGVDPFVVMAICERESACTSNILGDSGRAYGMMQIQPVWIQDKLATHGYTEADLLMAEPNITIGIEILQDFLAKGRGIEWALTAYRYGPQQANACSTSDYSAWILSRADELRRQNEQRRMVE